MNPDPSVRAPTAVAPIAIPTVSAGTSMNVVFTGVGLELG